MRKPNWPELSIGGLAGFFFAVFVTGAMFPPGWTGTLETAAPLLAPAAAIFIAAFAVWHSEISRRRDRDEEREAFLPFVAREIDSTVTSAINFSKGVPTTKNPWTDAEDVQLARLEMRVLMLFGTDDRPSIAHADRIGVLGKDAADLTFRIHSMIHGAAVASMRLCLARGAMPSVETFDVFRHAVGSAVVMRCCLAGAIFGRVNFDSASRDDIRDTLLVLGIAGTGEPRADLKAIAEHCDAMHWYDTWSSTF
ncbi:hypothetical protein [Candidatus Phaeomarinobacter ectocarpi]|uniref:hypothetical protein n=1 Tax=Candidatus Phaeomarinibacter ectocarpi TaxID=1458461 RepID=UPI0005C66204|nr:hypothetical protein [Candidatus Phaeomarinobacter ectocarpi]